MHKVIIIGAGPGGTTAAALLAKQGIDVGLIEQDEFPRFKVGESLLPYSLDILKKSGVYSTIDSGQHIRKYGAQFVDWKEPDKEVYFVFKNGLDPDHPFSFEVERAKFDNELLEHAQGLGVTFYQPHKVLNVSVCESHVSLETTAGTLKCEYLVDASGRSAFFGRNLGMRKRHEDFNNIAVFTHFDHVSRQPNEQAGDIVIGTLPGKCWTWMIPFQGTATSIGVVVDANTYKNKKMDENFIRETINSYPTFAKRMMKAQAMRPAQVVSNYSGYCEKLISHRWILLGDAASFLDPVFSTGVHVALQSADFASDVILQAIESNLPLSETSLGQSYENKIHLGIRRFRKLLRLFYDTEFVKSMQRVLQLPLTLQAFTSAVAGDAWNEENPLFHNGFL